MSLEALVGFKLPVAASRVTYCAIEFPAHFLRLQDGSDPKQDQVVVARAASWDWNEDTVTGENALASTGQLASEPVFLTGADLYVVITQACKSADPDGQFSIYVQAYRSVYDSYNGVRAPTPFTC